MSRVRRAVRRAALTVSIAVTVPYVALKVMWLSGSTIGTTSTDGAAEMSGSRFVTGNLVTILLMVVALAFVFAVTRPWALRVPAWLVLVLGAGATGLLAPILVGLPLGLVIQLALEGAVKPADETGLAPWVFAVVYSGFGLLAVSMAILVAAYVLERWGHLTKIPPQPPGPLPTVIGAVGLLPFGVAAGFWGVSGPGSTGPEGMDLPAQRTVLIVTGILSVAAFVIPFLRRRAGRWPRTAWLIVWTGACVCALQGPALILLAQGGDVRPGVALIALVATPGACIYGLAVLGRRLSGATRDARVVTPS